jgi:ABC-type multidrug transport system fused ATPase/permease subunit
MLKIFPAGFKWLALVFLTVVRAFLEMAGLALFVPLLLLLLEEDGISKNEWLNRVYTGLNIDSFGSFLLLICGVVLLFTLLKNLALHKINNHQNRSLLKIFSHYSESLFTRYYNKGLLFIKESSSHALSHNTNSVCYSYVFGVLSPAISLAGDLILAILIVASLAYVNIYIALIEVILFIPFVLFYQMKIGGELQRAGKSDNEAKKTQWRVTIETFRGYAEIEVNNSFPKLINVFKKGLDAISNYRVRTESLKSISSRLIEIGVIVVIMGVILTGYFFDSTGGDFRLLVALFAVATIKLMPALRSVVSQYSVIKSNMYTLEIIKDIHKEADIDKEQVPYSSTPLKFDNKLEFRNVCFGYDDRDLTLNNFSITINKGEKVGIKGDSGSGKSTLFYLLLGLYNPSRGDIYIDDTLLSPQNRGEWHKRVGYVSQDIFIMDTTLAENIVLAQETDYDRLNMAIERASLKCLVDSLPMGIDTRIGDNGCRLSGGEKQRVAIARALYKKADVFLLDEPTSALDSKTEDEITKTLEHPAFQEKNMTIVIVSHKESMLSICDRIIDLS